MVLLQENQEESSSKPKYMQNVKCKKCKRATEKLFLKGDRCFSPKCSLTRASFAAKGKKSGPKKFRKKVSEYGMQLMGKQRVKFGYGLKEEQFVRYVKEAEKSLGGTSSSTLFGAMERRLDNVVYRMGLTDGRRASRQMVNHGHITVNGRKVDVPSFRVKVGDKVAIRKESSDKGFFKDIDLKLKKHTTPIWIGLDKDKKEATILAMPDVDSEDGMLSRLNQIIEFYSR